MNFFKRLKIARDRNVTVANLVDELVRLKGDCEVSRDDAGAFTLCQLHAEIRAMGRFLRNTAKMQPGEPVAIYRTNTRECFHWFLAIIRAGGVAVPLNPMLQGEEVRRILERGGIKTLITDRPVFDKQIKLREALPVATWIDSSVGENSAIEEILRFDVAAEIARLAVDPHSDPPAVIDPRATIAVFHTSGTSGFPKGAALSSNALLGARATSPLTSFLGGSNDLALVALPWSHIMAVSIALYGLMAGIRGAFLTKFDVEEALGLIERHGITAMVGVPAMFARLMNADPAPERLKTLRLFLSASDYLPTEVRERLRAHGAFARLPLGRRVPPVLVNGYGMVELGGLAMMGVDLSFLPGSGDLCFPVPPYEVRVVDEAGKPVKRGSAGECQIRRRGTRPHYWNEKANESGLMTDDGWLRTGDLATKNRLGLVRLVGRAKDVIKSGGYSVYVQELEEALVAHPAVARAAAFGLPHAEKGESPSAAVELKADATTSEAELVDWCRQRLAPYKSPRQVWIVPTGGLPQNANGKILRRELTARYSQQSTGYAPRKREDRG